MSGGQGGDGGAQRELQPPCRTGTLHRGEHESKEADEEDAQSKHQPADQGELADLAFDEGVPLLGRIRPLGQEIPGREFGDGPVDAAGGG